MRQSAVRIMPEKLKLLTIPNISLCIPSCSIVEFAGLSDLASSMYKVMVENSGVGLAAPQIGYNIQMLIIDKDPMFRQSQLGHFACEDFFCLVNPTLQPTKSNKIQIVDQEGCLSFPGTRDKVDRYEEVEISAVNVKGEPSRFIIDGLVATILQHEIDHLVGILFPFRSSSSDTWFKYSKNKMEMDRCLSVMQKNSTRTCGHFMVSNLLEFCEENSIKFDETKLARVKKYCG